jgi:1-acyl-sn-glycerol-3-phosphate acyltransferase
MLALLGFSMRVRNAHRVPRKGGVLLIANHQSFLDPPVIGIAANQRHLNYLARKTLFKVPAFAALIETLGAVPINQEMSGTEGIKTTLALLRAGKAVLVFPEGARTGDGKIHDLKPGIVVLIRRAGVPILPIGIAGAYESYPIHAKKPKFAPLFLPANERGVAVVFGEPMDPKTLAALPPEKMLAKCHAVLSDLYQQAEQLRRKNRPLLAAGAASRG